MSKIKKQTTSQRLQTLLGELKRRKVFQVTSVYLVAAWGLSAGASDIFAALDFPEWAPRYFVITIFSLTPIVIVIAWVFELNKSGLQRDTGSNSPVDQDTIFALNSDQPVIKTRWQGRSQSFAAEFVVGRDAGCGLQIVDPMVSRRHAKFDLVGGRWKIEDLGSANGIAVNGKKVKFAWLERDASIRLYPNGPELKIAIEQPAADRTRMAP
ncbi:MAG: FHA domain-containing protein, partial [Gammaproteobacteria bacterium]|nr:FHA domain-containing protein [Gammaproteobacteria bacterium]